MKRSNQVILSALFLSAVSAASAKGQELSSHQQENKGSDSTQSRHHSSSYAGHSGTHPGFWSFFHRGSHQNPKVAQTTGPRTGGFGNTLRTASS